MGLIPFLQHDPQDIGPQYLEDLATGYWFSEALFTAVELEVFSLLESEGMTTDEIAVVLEMPVSGLERFLQALCAMNLVVCDNKRFYNTNLASEYLCLLYTSDAADEEDSVDLGGRRIIKKK